MNATRASRAALALVAAIFGTQALAADPQVAQRTPIMPPGLWRTTMLSQTENGKPVPPRYLMSIRVCDLKRSIPPPQKNCHVSIKRDEAGRVVRDETCVLSEGFSTHEVTTFLSSTHTQALLEDSLAADDDHPSSAGTAESEETYEGACPVNVKDGQLVTDDGKVVGMRDLLAGALLGAPPTASEPTAAAQTNVNFDLSVRTERELTRCDSAGAVAWSPDGSRIAAECGDTLKVWDRAGRAVSQIDVGGGPNIDGSLAFAKGASELLFPPPDGASDNAALSVRSVRDRRLVATFDGPNPGQTSDKNRAAHFKMSRDQRTLVAGGRAVSIYPNVAVYASPDWRLVKKYLAWTVINDVAIFDDGSKIAVGGYGVRPPYSGSPVEASSAASRRAVLYSGVTIIDLKSDQAPRWFAAPDGGDVSSVAVSPDGSEAFIGMRATAGAVAYVLSTVDGAKLAEFDWPERSEVEQAQFDPKGRYVAFADRQHGELVLWRAHAGKPSYLRVPAPNGQGLIWQFAISPDGRQIAIASDDSITIYQVS